MASYLLLLCGEASRVSPLFLSLSPKSASVILGHRVFPLTSDLSTDGLFPSLSRKSVSLFLGHCLFLFAPDVCTEGLFLSLPPKSVSLFLGDSLFLFPRFSSLSVSVSAQDGIVAFEKAHMRSATSLSSLPKVALETVPIFVWLNTDRSRPRRVECRPLPFSTPFSFRRSVL